MSQPELVVDARAQLGEGPVWDERAQELIWVDIVGQMVHRFRPSDGRVTSLSVPKAVGAVAIRSHGGLVLALEDGFWILDLPDAEPRPFALLDPPAPGILRMNDGKVDREGRFWAGTTAWDDRAGDGAGALYRLDPDGGLRRMLDGVSISNGLDWDPDGRLMYFVDTPTQRIDVFDYDGLSGEIERRRTLVEVPHAAGAPDGLTVDAEGGIWVALWGGSAVHRYTPEGTLERTLHVPASQVSSCAFGGRQLDELYVTTAAIDLPPDEAARQPHAGGLFRCRPGVRGRPAGLFAG
ncbi:MAG: SMP-30/gluconolactonase/LRE family protein [Chloroflexi bacterium]|nr:SMP-30/gluconolactonase/LRE family protein [Chloroflexota bacterium]